ncbi:MAG TPA: metalloregulator ArsR/SmtB family transcription factor [Anaerolineales bacterium]
MDVFTALSDPTRRSILEMLARAGHLSASDIYDRFPVSHPAISQHLKVLREAGLVQVERKAQFRYYRINPQPIQDLGVWAQKMAAQWEERFSALDALLQEEQDKIKRDGMERGEGNE